jgi:acetyl-CoA carboxylase carboxyltransferase component
MGTDIGSTTATAGLAAVPPDAPLRVPGRVQALIDPETFQPLRSAVIDGVICGSARVAGREVVTWAQEGAHRGGSLGPAGGETIVHAIQRADRAGVPIVGLPHSGGARLQAGVSALSAYAAIFRTQALARVPQITMITGPCAGGAAYSPALGDFVVMVGPEAQMFLTGPRVVEQVMREETSAQDLGGARVHARNGVAQLFASGDVEAAGLLRELLSYLPSPLGGPVPLAPPADTLDGSPDEPLPTAMRQVYDVRDVIARLVDRGQHLELAPRWAPNMVTAFARLDGGSIGVIANQARYLGGTIDSAASEKGSWFVNMCDRFGIPLVVLVDTPGFLPGTKQERAGVIRYGAGLLRAFSRASVPRLTVTLRQAYGGAHIVMNSRGLGADLTLAWPGAQIGIMGARQAVAITERRMIAAGADIDELAAVYEETKLKAAVAAAEGHIDEIVAPEGTRDYLIRALELRR